MITAITTIVICVLIQDIYRSKAAAALNCRLLIQVDCGIDKAVAEGKLLSLSFSKHRSNS